MSINSTGLCITSDSHKPKYYIITSKMSKRQKAFNHNRITIIEYKKTDNLSDNIREIGKVISLVLENNPNLGILNGYVRALLDVKGIPFTTVRPTSWKKQMLGNGFADKAQTIASWKLLDPIDFKGIKVDDISDSYFLSLYNESSGIGA